MGHFIRLIGASFNPGDLAFFIGAIALNTEYGEKGSWVPGYRNERLETMGLPQQKRVVKSS